MAREVCSEEHEPKALSQVQNPVEEDDSAPQKEFDFIERPAEDFFCPVTFELLLNPHQTTCCGNHLSEKAVRRLQRDSKPCPMCKESELSTMPDKFHRRRVSAVRVRCPHTSNGCDWVGEVGVVDQHTAACPKRPWKCQYCEFTSTNDVEREHVEQCTKYPVPCPNKCEIGTVSRCDVEKHCTECPLELVACEFVDVGCSAKMPRRDLMRHIEESQQQHLLSATLLNLKLTKETITELNRQLVEKERKLDEKERQLEEKDRQLEEKDCRLVQKDKNLLEKDMCIAVKDKVIAEKDVIIYQKDEAIAMMVAKKDRIIAEKETQLSELKVEFKKNQQEFMESTKSALERLLKEDINCVFMLERFSVLQATGYHGDWFSDPFSAGEYELKLNLETLERGPIMKIRLYPKSDHMCRSATFDVTLQLLNQLGNHSHYSKKFTIKLDKGSACSDSFDFIAFQELYEGDKTVQYLKNDKLKLRIMIDHIE